MSEKRDVTTRERCQMCHRVSPVGFWVPGEVWKAAIHIHWQESPICIMCFADRADERQVEWDKDIRFYPVSLVSHLRRKGWGVPATAATLAALGGKERG